MENLNDTLLGRVDDLIESEHRTRLLSTTGTRAALEELVERNDRLERAIRELASEVERLTMRFERTLTRLDQPPTAYSVRLPPQSR
jgi:hypothetical protein